MNTGLFTRCALLASIVCCTIPLSSPAQSVVTCSFNKDGYYKTAFFGVPRETAWESNFSATVSNNSFSVCFYKVYYLATASGSGAVNTAIQAPSGRHSVIGYTMYYWKDGFTEQNAVANKWSKTVNPNLECAEIGTCCSTAVRMGMPNKCGAAWAIESGFDWRQSPLQCVTLGNLEESKKYHFVVYFWTCPPTTITSLPNGYYAAANFPPRYETLRSQQTNPYIQWNWWIAKGTFITGKKPPPSAGGAGGVRYR